MSFIVTHGHAFLAISLPHKESCSSNLPIHISAHPDLLISFWSA
jgi:hypothetical protein